jgi:hypothetical protein
MSPNADTVTAALVSVAYLVWGAIMLLRAGPVREGMGDVITGLSAWMVSAIYSAPLLLDIPVVELRWSLRLALFIYAGNQIIKNRQFVRGKITDLLRGLTHRR